MSVNRVSVSSKISRAFSKPSVEENFYSTAERKFKNSKKRFLNEIFPNDDTTITLRSNDPVRGYLGIEAGENPTEDLRQIFEREIQIARRPKHVKRGTREEAVITYRIDYPTHVSVYSEEVLALPWISKSWVQAIEQGLGNVEYYMFKRGKGRSTFGIQVPKAIGIATEYVDPQYLRRLKASFQEDLQRRF